jgi:hypothetical protein
VLLFRADKQADVHDEANSRISQLLYEYAQWYVIHFTLYKLSSGQFEASHTAN